MSPLEDADKTPVEPFGARELRLARFRPGSIPEDAPTGRECPMCAGTGCLTEDTGATYASFACSLCDSAGWVTAEVAGEYRVRNAVRAAGKSAFSV